MGFPTYLKQFKNFADFLARGKGALSEADLALGKQYFDQMEKYNARKSAWEKVYGDKLRNLPESNAGLTQVTNTVPTYSKAGEELRRLGAEGPAIDFGAGKGLGTKHLGPQVESYEPFPEAGFSPTFTNAADIPSDKYGALANLNVLNVLPREIRDQAVLDIGRVMRPGGLGVVTVRNPSFLKSTSGIPGPDESSLITGRETFQKGFTKPELQDYMKYMLGSRFEVSPATTGNPGALIRKKAEGGLAHLAGGGQAYKMFQQLYRGYAGKPGAEEIFASPQKRVAEYYAKKRAAQTGMQPGVEAVQVDPFAGKQYGHALPIDQFNKDVVTTQARKLSPLDVLNPPPNRAMESKYK